MLLGWPFVVQVFFPDNAQEERTRAVHYGDVWHEPIPVVASKGVDYRVEEGVSGDRAHGIVADSRGNGTADPGWV